MKTKTLITLAVIFISSFGFSQSNYNDYNENDKKSVFFDDLSDNRNNWLLENNSDYTFSIYNGKFILTDKNNGGWDDIFQNISIDINKDFEIEYKAKLIYDNKYGGIRLFFGEKYNKSNLIAIAGIYNAALASGSYDSPYKYTNDGYIKYTFAYNYFNTFIVRKVNKKIYFFYNKELIFSSTIELIPIKQIGFMLSNKNSLELDYLKVSYLEKGQNKKHFAKANNHIDNLPPEITITYPDVTRGFKVLEQNKKITIQGKVTDAGGIYEVLISGQEAYVDSQGNFSKTVFLAFGENLITVSATDLKQNTSTKDFTIERKSNQQEIIVVNKQIANSSLQTGKYYALIIGVQDYNDPKIIDLDQPLSDAQRIYNVLIKHYTFEQKNIKFLKNPSKNEITKSLDYYFANISAKDNLLVFYAGHGYWDENFEQGYWLAADSDRNNRGTWFSNGTLRDYMRAIPTKHSLLITDACFGGGIFKSRDAFANASIAINQLYELPSRKAMTSGALKEVPDKSVFIEYLVKRLEQNTKKYLSSEQLFASFKIAVINNSLNGQIPQFGEVKETGDEGGDFIFIRK
ncbi:MAG: caspase family protein [Bacteroidales bacterium]|nr:caspase family protein [Bacteroidales bacterium]